MLTNKKNNNSLPPRLENVLIVMCVSYYKSAGLGTTTAAVGPVASVKRGDVQTGLSYMLMAFLMASWWSSVAVRLHPSGRIYLSRMRNPLPETVM